MKIYFYYSELYKFFICSIARFIAKFIARPCDSNRPIICLAKIRHYNKNHYYFLYIYFLMIHYHKVFKQQIASLDFLRSIFKEWLSLSMGKLKLRHVYEWKTIRLLFKYSYCSRKNLVIGFKCLFAISALCTCIKSRNSSVFKLCITLFHAMLFRTFGQLMSGPTLYS